jgi:hypothetical protein
MLILAVFIFASMLLLSFLEFRTRNKKRIPEDPYIPVIIQITSVGPNRLKTKKWLYDRGFTSLQVKAIMTGKETTLCVEAGLLKDAPFEYEIKSITRI